MTDLHGYCQCDDCFEKDVACQFDCDYDSIYMCEGCVEANQAILDEEFDIKASQGSI